jgi:hypothetical protein
VQVQVLSPAQIDVSLRGIREADDEAISLIVQQTLTFWHY